MPYQVCKECGKAFSGKSHSMGRPKLYCETCSSSTAANRRSRQRKSGELPQTFSCWICSEHCDDQVSYPICSEACRDRIQPSLCKALSISQKQLKLLIDRGGLFIALQDPTFSLSDAANLKQQLL
jgi:hypothetical protein